MNPCYEKLFKKRLFISGGAGFLGKHLIKKYQPICDHITVFSRDEAKHYYLSKLFPDVQFVVGDIRNLDSLTRAVKGHDVAIFAASLKQIEAVNDNAEEAASTIITGGINSQKAALDNDLLAACFISSDKSRAATTLYGAMKFVAGETFIRAPSSCETNLSCAIYGNVMNSTGSVIPLIWNAIHNNYELKLYSKDMTRFMLTIEEAMDLIDYALGIDGYNVIPRIASFKIIDLFEIYASRFGLRYSLGLPRPSEKIHEIMIAEEELPRVTEQGGFYTMHYERIAANRLSFPANQYSSQDCCISKDALDRFLQKHSYYA